MAATTAPGGAAERRRLPERLDGWLLLSALLLVTVGLMAVYSEGDGRRDYGNFQRQVINTVIGLVPFGIMFGVHPNFWRRTRTVWYVVMLGLLFATLRMGKDAKGAQRWIDVGPIQFQPSEIAKMLAILCVSAYFADRQNDVDKPGTFFGSLLYIGLPTLLVFAQPHLGATMVLLVMWLAVALVAGVPGRYFAVAAATLAVGLGSVVAVPAVRDRVLKGYQQERLVGLFSKSKDNRGRNYQADQAAIAFGVGGVFGSGYLRGDQKRNGYIPEQRNDFVFTVVGEEGGLVGGGLVLAAFGFFFYRIFLILLHAGDPYYRGIAAGIFAVLGFHLVVNLGMVLQLLPVVGLWLPFLSSGGTAIWLCMACVGLLLNLRRRERPLLF